MFRNVGNLWTLVLPIAIAMLKKKSGYSKSNVFIIVTGKDLRENCYILLQVTWRKTLTLLFCSVLPQVQMLPKLLQNLFLRGRKGKDKKRLINLSKIWKEGKQTLKQGKHQWYVANAPKQMLYSFFNFIISVSCKILSLFNIYV